MKQETMTEEMTYKATKNVITDMKKRVGFSDLLGYAALIKEDVVLMKDGALQAVFRFYGDDIQSVVEEMSVAYSLRWSQAVAGIWTDNVIIEHDVIRHKVGSYSSELEFPDIVSALIDQERRYQFESAGQLYESITYVTFTWREARELSAKTKQFIYNTEDQARAKTPQERLQEFESKLRQFTQFVAFGQAKKFQRQSGDKLVSFLKYCIDDDNTTMAAPSQQGFLDFYLAKREFLPGFQPKVGDKYIKVLTIDQYPVKLRPMMMHLLNTLPLEFRYHTRYVLLNKSKASSLLKRIQVSWSSKAIGMKGVIVNAFGGQAQLNEAAEFRNQETKLCIAENEDGEVKYGLYNASFVFFDEELAELNRKVADFVDHVQNLGFILREERVNASEAYLGSLPGHGNANVRMNPFDSIAWAYSLPISAIYSGEAVCPNPLYPEKSPPLFYAVTDDTNVYRYNAHVSDVGHTLTIGPTGNGKTLFEALKAAQHRKYPQSRYIALDKDKSHKVALLAMGGVYYDPEDIESVKIAVFSHITDHYGFELAFRWLCDTFSINGVSMTSSYRQQISESLKRLANLPHQDRKFTNLEFQEPALRATFNNLKTSIFGSLVDGTDDHMFTHDIIGIDIGAIMKLEPLIAGPIIKAIIDKLTYLFQDKRPTRLLLEEGWLLLDNKEFRKEIKNWFKTLRKFVVGVDFVSQSLSDIMNNELANVIVESCPTINFLPNEAANTPSIKAQYQAIGLNEKEIQLLAAATPKKHYYIKQSTGNRLIDLGVGEVTLAFLGISSSEDIETFEAHFKKEDQRWVIAYLKAKGLNDAAKFVSTQYFKDTENLGNDA